MMQDKLIGHIENDVYRITAPQGDISNNRPWAQDVPAFDGSSYQGIYSGGDGSFIVCIDRATLAEIERYTQKLMQCGYRKFAENKIASNRFFTYENGFNLVYCYYIAYTQSIKIIAEPFYPYITATPRQTLSRPAIIASSVCDRNFYVRLPDNTLLVIDGGWRIEDWCLYDHAELIHKMYLEMSQILGNAQTIHVSMWLITHAHTDHARVLETLYQTDWSAAFQIDQILYNFPAPNHIANTDEATAEQLAQMDRNIRTWHAEAGVSFPYERIFYNCPFRVYDTSHYEKVCRHAFMQYPATQINAHTGMHFDLSGVTLDVLHTPDDDMPTLFNNFNNTSLVVRMTYQGSPMLWLGDMGELPSDSCVKMYGNLLKCDCMQVSHHGWGAATPEFYALARPSILFWNNSEFGFKHADSHQGYGKTKTSTDLYHMDCIVKNYFCNRIHMSHAYLPVQIPELPPFKMSDFIIASSAVSDRTYYLRLPNSQLIVIGGGWRDEDWAQYDHDALLRGMYHEMCALVGTSNVTIAAFLIPNQSADYHRFLDTLPVTDFLNHLQINSVICSSLPAHCIKGAFSTADFQKEPCFSKRFSLCSPRTGDVLHFGNVQAHVLYAPNANSQYDSIGDTSLVVRFVYQGKGILITGDMTDSLSEQLLSRYGSHLRSDVVQIANHGWNNCGSVQFYQAVAAQLQLWTNSEYGFQFFRKDEGYQKTPTATAIYHLSTCRQNAFCDQVSMQRFHFPLEAAELQQDV